MKKKKTLIIIILIIGGLVCFGGVFLAKGIDFPYSFGGLFDTGDITIENLEEIYGEDLSEFKDLIKSDEVNITEALLDKLISPTGEIQQELSQADIERIVEEISKTRALEFIPEISEVDLNISSDTSKEAVEAYLISVTYIWNKNIPIKGYKLEAILEGDMQYADEFAKDLASGDERKIDETVKAFQKIYVELRELEVPPPVLEFHKLALEISSGMTGFLEELKFIESDPMRVLLAMRGLELLKNKAQELDVGLQELIEKYEPDDL